MVPTRLYTEPQNKVKKAKRKIYIKRCLTLQKMYMINVY